MSISDVALHVPCTQCTLYACCHPYTKCVKIPTCYWEAVNQRTEHTIPKCYSEAVNQRTDNTIPKCYSEAVNQRADNTIPKCYSEAVRQRTEHTIPTCYSEAVNQWTDNTMAKWKITKWQTMIHKPLHTKLHIELLKTRGWYERVSSSWYICGSCYKSDDTPYMRKGQHCVYDNQNTSVVIRDRYVP